MDAPPAPWDLAATSVVWLAPPNRAARAALLDGIGGTPAGVVGAFVSYADTPVGPYDEVIGSIGLRRGAGVAGHIPFIAVDSADSVQGGRANWFLPKTLAAFEGEPGARMEGRGEDWAVRATVRACGPAVPLPLRATVVQPGPDGRETRTRTSGHARARLALVSVEVTGPPAAWLRSGRYPGVLLEDARLRFGVPTPPR